MRKDTVRKIHRRNSQQARFGGSCRSVCIAARSRIHDVDQLKSRLIEEWEHSTRCSSMKRSGSGVHVFQLAFEHTGGILNIYFSYVWYLYRRTLRQSYVCAVAYSGHFYFWGDLTKPSITIASVDRFYLNLVICLQLDRILLKSDIVCRSYDNVGLYRGLLFSWTQCILCPLCSFSFCLIWILH